MRSRTPVSQAATVSGRPERVRSVAAAAVQGHRAAADRHVPHDGPRCLEMAPHLLDAALRVFGGFDDASSAHQVTFFLLVTAGNY